MMDIEWLKENTERYIESINQRKIISAEQQGLLNILNGTLALIGDMEYLLNEIAIKQGRRLKKVIR